MSDQCIMRKKVLAADISLTMDNISLQINFIIRIAMKIRQKQWGGWQNHYFGSDAYNNIERNNVGQIWKDNKF